MKLYKSMLKLDTAVRKDNRVELFALGGLYTVGATRVLGHLSVYFKNSIDEPWFGMGITPQAKAAVFARAKQLGI